MFSTKLAPSSISSSVNFDAGCAVAKERLETEGGVEAARTQLIPVAFRRASHFPYLYPRDK
jgi:hypothetical protein